MSEGSGAATRLTCTERELLWAYGPSGPPALAPTRLRCLHTFPLRATFHRLSPFFAACALATARAESPQLLEARQALSESLPQVALYKLRALLAKPGLPPAEQPEATLLLAHALSSAGQLDEALAALQPLAVTADPRVTLLRADVLAATGHWSEARPLYHSLAALPKATVGEAEALQALGRPEDAVILLESLVHAGTASTATRIRYAVLLAELRRLPEARQALVSLVPGTPEENKWKQYAEARILLAEDQAAPALQTLEAILEDREALPESLLVAATFGATDARLSLHGTLVADDVLEDFIWKHPTSAYLPSVFLRLDQIYAQEEDPSESELRKWSQNPEQRRAALARFYLGRMQVRSRKWDRAPGTLDYFLRTYPNHPLAGEAWLLQAEIATNAGNYAQAVQNLESAMRVTADPALRPIIELRTGLAHFQQGEYLLSATLFEGAARHSSRIRPVATFNAALAWLHVHNFDRFGEQYRAFIQQQPESPLRGELLLEEGLEQARIHDPAAPETFKSFLRDYPRSPRQAEARLALAEIALVSGEAADPALLQAANTIPPAPEIAAQSAYLAIFLADAQQPPDEAKVIALAQKFLSERHSAPQTPEVRMKLGQVYFRRGDYANAETQFATLAGDAGGPYAEAALFLAGESAMKLINPGSVDRALGYFDRVVKIEGSFKLYARQEQAIMQSRLEHDDQAVELYGVILATAGVDPDLWQAALCGKGDSLLTLGRRALPATERIDEAIAAFDQLAKAPGVTAVWRNQALYKKAKALEQLGRNEEALATFYDVLNGPAQDEHEYFWFYKAGFDAARAYEQQENWKSAIGIYQKMVKLEGPRTPEAQSRLREVRLEHFIWE